MLEAAEERAVQHGVLRDLLMVIGNVAVLEMITSASRREQSAQECNRARQEPQGHEGVEGGEAAGRRA
eukprot:1596255-Pyramimonas_sp.AAC.1